jgi:hypothetical protein
MEAKTVNDVVDSFMRALEPMEQLTVMLLTGLLLLAAGFAMVAMAFRGDKYQPVRRRPAKLRPWDREPDGSARHIEDVAEVMARHRYDDMQGGTRRLSARMIGDVRGYSGRTQGRLQRHQAEAGQEVRGQDSQRRYHVRQADTYGQEGGTYQETPKVTP